MIVRTQPAAVTVAHSRELDDFGAFYESTYRHAFRTALAILGDPSLADDAVQDAYVAAFRARDRFRSEAPAEAWLTRIVVHTAISAARKRRVRWTDPMPLDATARPTADVVVRSSILDALQSLPPEQRAAIVLRYDRDLDYESIARALGTTSGTVGSWLSRALRRLHRELGDEVAGLPGEVPGNGPSGPEPARPEVHRVR